MDVIELIELVDLADTGDLADLGHRIDADGLATHELAVRRLVRSVRAAGLGGPAVDVLADTAAPDVARLRAFAAVSASCAAATCRRRELPTTSAASRRRPVA